MADADKLWFDWGIRGDVLQQLEKATSSANELQRALIAASDKLDFKSGLANVEEMERVFDKFEQTLKRVGNLRPRLVNDEEINALDKLEEKVNESYGAFKAVREQLAKDPGKWSEKDLVRVMELAEGFNLLNTSVNRYLTNAEKIASANEKIFDSIALGQMADLDKYFKSRKDLERGTTEEEKKQKRVSEAKTYEEEQELKAVQEINEALREQEQLRQSINEAAERQIAELIEFERKRKELEQGSKESGNDRSARLVAEAKAYEEQQQEAQVVKEINEMLAVKEAMQRRIDKEEAEAAREINEALEKQKKLRADLKNNLEQSYQQSARLSKLVLDTESQKEIAQIKGNTGEVDALEQKLGKIRSLLAEVREEQAALVRGDKTEAILTNDVVTAKLDQINREYNQTLAETNKRESENREKKQKLVDASKQLIASQQDLISSFDKVTAAGKRTNDLFDQVKAQIASTVSLYAMEGLLKSVIQVGGEFEVQHIALQSILGDIQQANTMFNEIKQLAVVSPFNFSQLIAYSKQIAAFGIPYEEMYDTTKRLADMSAGLGVDMSRLILAYGQVRSAAVLRGQELRQFTEAGIPMVQALADEFTRLNGRVTTTGEVFDLISKRAVPFEMVKKILWDMTNEGGRFFNMQFTLADTLAGKWSNLEDAWQIMLSEFAKGESLGGRILKTFVQGLTDLIEALDKIGPLVGGLGMARLGRYVQGGFSSLLGNDIEKNVIKAQQLHAIELKRRYLNMEITREQYNQGMALNKSRENYYMLLAQEGRMKESQIARAIQQKKINTESLKERVIKGELTMREAAQLRLWKMKYAQASIFNLKLKEIGLTLKTMMGPFGWISLAIDGIVMGMTSWYLNSERAADQMKEASDNFTHSARDREREINDTLKGYNEKSPSNDSEYKNAIDAMKEQLKQYDANYNSIMREVDSLGSLQEKYELLKKELGYVAESYELAGKNKAEFDRLQESTSGLTESTKTWATANDYLNRSLNTLAAEGSKEVENAIDKLVQKVPKLNEVLLDSEGNRRNTNDFLKGLADQMSNNDIQTLRNALRGPSAGGHALWDKYVSVFENLNDEDRKMFDKYLSDAQKRNMRYDREINGELLKIVDATYTQVAAQLGMKADALRKKVAEEGNNLDQRTKTMLRDYFSQQMSAITNGNQALMQWVDSQRWTLFFHYDIVTDYTEKAAGLQGIAGTAWNRLNSGGGPVANPQGHTGFTEKDLKDAFGPSGNDVNNAKKVLSQRLHDQENLVTAMKTTKDATEEQKNEATKLLNAMEADWNQMFTDDWRNLNSKGNPKAPKGSKKDTALESLKNRIDLYKRFYQELQGYKDIYGESGALDVLKNDGEFGKVFDWKNTYNLSDITNYKQTLDELTKGFNANTEARQKLIDTTKADIENKQRREAVENIKAYVSELKKMMSVMAENYQTYRKWLDLTGDENLAARAAGVTKNTSYADYLREQMQKALAAKPQNALSVDEVLGLSESDIAEKFGKESGIVAIWDEWRKHQQMLKKEQWDLYEEAIKNAKDYDEKIADINRDLEKQIAAIEALGGDNKLIGNARRNAAKKISSIKWDQFKDNNDWGRVFGNLDNMPLESIRKMIAAMKEYAKTTKMDVTETKAWYEALEKLTDRKAILDPLGSLADAVRNYQAAHNKRKIVEEQIERTKNNPELSDSKRTKLLNKLQQTRNQLLDQETEEMTKASKAIKSFSSSIGKLGSSLQQLGSSIGGNFGDFMGGIGGMLGDLSSGMSSIGDLATAMSQKGFTGAIGKVSAAIGIISSTISMVQKLDSILPNSESLYEKYAERQRKINQAREAIEDYEVESLKRQQKNQNWLYSNGLSEMRSNGYVRTNLLKNYANTQLAAQEIYQDKRSGLAKWGPAIVGAIVAIVITAVTWGLGSVGGAAVGSGIAAALGSAGTAAVGAAVAAGAGAAIGTALRSAGDQIFYKEGQTAARNNLRVQTQHSSFWRGEKTQNLEDWVRENYGKELFNKDNYDLIDVELAKKLLENGPTLVGETRETLERLVEIAEQIQEIQDQIHDYVGNMFSPLIDNMTDSLWDWLKDGTNMMDSFYDYASDTFANLAKDAVKSFLKINLLDNYTKTLEDIFNAYSFGLVNEAEMMLGVAHVAGEIGEAFENLSPVLQELGTVLADAFELKGYDIVNGNSSSSASNSLKSISETAGDLIASYINGMRADLSAHRATVAIYYPQFLSAMLQSNTIADAQLTQLRSIVENTRRNREFVERIYDILHGVAPDGTKIQVK